MPPHLRTNPLPQAEHPDAAVHAAALNELVGLGMDLARRIHAAAVPPSDGADDAPAPDLPEIAAAFDRTARAVRRTVLLARHLRDHPAPAAADQARARFLVRREAIRAVENELDRSPRPQPDRDALRREFLERLDSPDTEADLLDLPTDHVVAAIRRDLGLDPAPALFKRRTPADIHALHQVAAVPPRAHPARPHPDARPGDG